jgi:hypothetical protein
MPDRERAADWELAQADHDIAIAIAQYCKRFPRVDTDGVDPSTDNDAHLYLVTTATAYAACDNLGEWSLVANDYKITALPENTAIKKSNAIVAARAIYLRAAITRLLLLTGAPPAMIADVGALLAPLCAKGAKQRAASQKAILDDPDGGVRGAAREAKTSPGQISKDRQDGTIVAPTDGVWTSPS